jgi:SAM-dependent methyltransferase
MATKSYQNQTKDFLWENISQLPYFRGLLRAVEARYYQNIELEQPVLDLGCGDGHFASTTFANNIDYGVDPWLEPLKEAKERNFYKICLQAAGAVLPFPDRYFHTVISNSVLEHIPDLDPVMNEVSRVLIPGGKFIFCVPNHRFLASLSVSNFLDRIRLKKAGNDYRKFFNKISRHYHCDDPDTWNNRLAQVGLEYESSWHYFSMQAFHVLEWGHYLGLPSLIWKKITKRWILSPTRWNLFFTKKITERFYQESERPNDGVYSFYIFKKPELARETRLK